MPRKALYINVTNYKQMRAARGENVMLQKSYLFYFSLFPFSITDVKFSFSFYFDILFLILVYKMFFDQSFPS